jgi:hypothetical protein
MKTIIALTGVKFSGKTTAFNFLKEIMPSQSPLIEIQLAKKLKDECSRVFKIERNLFDDSKLKEVSLEMPIYLSATDLTDLIRSYGVEPDYDTHVRPHVGMVLESPRRVAQYIGTEVLRTVNEDIHCMGATMNLPENGTFVVTDMRFPNEFNFFNKNYGECFHPFYIQNNQAELAGAQDMHPSERMVLVTAKRCKMIPNNSSISDFKATLLSLIETEFKKEPTGE